ncbi:MAG: hypothetical protein IMY76_08965 [Chloroflexi bacterium]|nr:hypothetical protein [Chloroflexota bacterium]
MNMDDINFDEIEENEDAPNPEESSNRTFLLVAGILGAIMIVSLVLMAVYAMMIVPNRKAAESTQIAEIVLQNTQVAMASKLTAEALAWTAIPTNTRTPIPVTATPSPTLVLAATNTPASGLAADDPRTATVAALFTQQAENLLTTTPVSTLLPDTGFGDDVGILGLVTLAGALVLIIFLARRFRTAN